jgi:hypothetical protein
MLDIEVLVVDASGGHERGTIEVPKARSSDPSPSTPTVSRLSFAAMDALQQTSRSDAASGPTPPRVLDAALVLVLLAALVNAAIGVLVAVQAPASRLPVVPALVVVVVAISVLYAAGLVVLAVLLRSGRTWARAALATLSSLSLLTLFALNALNLAVIVLLLVADVLLYRRAVSVWVRARRGIAPA